MSKLKTQATRTAPELDAPTAAELAVLAENGDTAGRRLIMPRRPTSITVLSWLCIVFGVCGFLVNFDDLTTPATHFGSNSLGMVARLRDSAWLTRLYPYHSYSDMHPLAMWLFPAQWLFLAICGVFMLYGFNWAR